MQQVQYLSGVNSRRNVWPPLGKLITNQTKTNWYPAWNHRQGFIYQRMAQKLHCDPQFDLKRFHGCDSAFFYLLLNEWFHGLPGIHRMKDYDNKASICWKTHLTACRFTWAWFQWLKQQTALTSYPTAPISRFCTIISCAKQGLSLIRDARYYVGEYISQVLTLSWKSRGERRHTQTQHCHGKAREKEDYRGDSGKRLWISFTR